MPIILPITPASVAVAAERLRHGGLVAFPTETVYGLGASTFDARALAQVYLLKQRPPDNPVIAHVLDAEAARRLVARWDDRARDLAARFWPGPLTLVLPKAAGVPAEATAGRPSIAVRCPSHPAARALLQTFGGAISAPSANRSGRVSPTAAEHVAEEFPESDLLILDAGPSLVGIESTVLELAGGGEGESPTARLLRPGSVTRSELESLLGPVAGGVVERQDASPGTRETHYAPTTPARLVAPEVVVSAIAGAAGSVVLLARRDLRLEPPHRLVRMPDSAPQYAARLYAALREADAAKASEILIEATPDAGGSVPPHEEGLWHAVADRLRRACARG